MTQHVVRIDGGDQTLRFVPVDRSGQPRRVTSATYMITDCSKSLSASDYTVVAETAATLAAVDTTLDDAAGPTAAHGSAQRVPVTSTANLAAGRSYLLSSVDGSSRELVLASGVDSGVALYGVHPVRGDYASGDLLQSIELEATVPSAEAAEDGEGGGLYQVTWFYSLNGESWAVPQTIRLARHSVATNVTEASVLLAYPPLADRGRGRFSVATAIAVALDDAMSELSSAGVSPAVLRGGHVLDVAIRNRAIEYMLRWCQTEADSAQADRYEQRYDRLIQNIIIGKPGSDVVEVDPATDQAGAADVSGYFVRS